jgi:hypothetical protein
VQIDEYDVSPFFQRANQEAIYSMLSAPLNITGMQATFMKDPVSVKIAPKDTSQTVESVKPDTTDFEAVFSRLILTVISGSSSSSRKILLVLTGGRGSFSI